MGDNVIDLLKALEDAVNAAKAARVRHPTHSPRERWGTCCPFDPECEHSFLDHEELAAHMDKRISDAEAIELSGG